MLVCSGGCFLVFQDFGFLFWCKGELGVVFFFFQLFVVLGQCVGYCLFDGFEVQVGLYCVLVLLGVEVLGFIYIWCLDWEVDVQLFCDEFFGYLGDVVCYGCGFLVGCDDVVLGYGFVRFQSVEFVCGVVFDQQYQLGCQVVYVDELQWVGWCVGYDDFVFFVEVYWLVGEVVGWVVGVDDVVWVYDGCVVWQCCFGGGFVGCFEVVIVLEVFVYFFDGGVGEGGQWCVFVVVYWVWFFVGVDVGDVDVLFDLWCQQLG